VPSYEDDDHEQAAGNAGETHSAEDAHAWALPRNPWFSARSACRRHIKRPACFLKAHTKVAEFLA